jgi:hypothetical protein
MKNRNTDKYNGSKHFKIGENQINPLTGRIVKVGSQKFNKLFRRYGDEELFKMMNNYNPDKYRDSKNFEIREEHKNPLTGRIITVGSQTFNKL